MTVGYGSSTTALAVNRDMTEGIIARFRTMAISRASVLTGHVVGALARTMVSIGLVIGVALILGFRPTADPVRWLATIGVIALLVLALSWLAVAIGLAASNAEGTSGFTLVVQVLRVRLAGLDVGSGALVRSERALHPDHRHVAGAADGHSDRQQRHRRRRLVRRPRTGRISLGASAVHKGSGAVN